MGADSGHGQADGRRWVFASRVRAVPIIVHEPARSHRGPAGYERRVSGAIPAASGPAGIAAGSGTVEKRPRENTTASQSCRGRPQGWPEPLQTTASMPPGPASGRGGTRRSRRCAPCRAAPTPARSALAVADVEARASFDEEFHDRERPLGRARFVEVRGGGERALRIGRVVEAECRGIGGQERRHVHVETKQIADGVGVFGAVQAMERGPAGIGARRGGGIHRLFERGGQRIEHGTLGTTRALRRITPSRSLRTTRSQASACCGAVAGSSA